MNQIKTIKRVAKYIAVNTKIINQFAVQRSTWNTKLVDIEKNFENDQWAWYGSKELILRVTSHFLQYVRASSPLIIMGLHKRTKKYNYMYINNFYSFETCYFDEIGLAALASQILSRLNYAIHFQQFFRQSDNNRRSPFFI